MVFLEVANGEQDYFRLALKPPRVFRHGQNTRGRFATPWEGRALIGVGSLPLWQKLYHRWVGHQQQ